MTEEVPNGWAQVALGDLLEPGGLFDGPFGSHLKTNDYTESGVRVVRLENVANLRFVGEKETYISPAKYRQLTKHTVAEGDIIVGSFVDGAVRVCVLPPLPTKAIAKADCFTVRTETSIANRRFVAYQLGTNAARDALVEEIHGATRPRITTRQLRGFPMRLAPIAEQRRIVSKVEALLEQVNRAKDRLDRVSLIVKQFRQAVLAAACSGELTREWRDAHGSPDWGTEPLQNVLAEPLANGRSVPDGDGFPVLRLSALRGGRVDLRERKRGAWTRKEAERFIVKRGDFLVARGNGSLSLVGRGGLVEEEPDPVAYPDTAIRVRPDRSRMTPAFLRIAWDSPSVRKQIEVAAHTTAGIHKVSQADLEVVELPVPSLEEQGEIVRQLGLLAAFAETIEHRVAGATVRAEKLPQAILARAFSGELVPTEARLARAEGRSYEAADELLSRVRVSTGQRDQNESGIRRAVGADARPKRRRRA